MAFRSGNDYVSSRPLKILQLFNRYLQPGGEEKSVARIATDLEAAGHRVLRFWRSSEEWTGREAPPRLQQPFLLWRNRPVLEELRAWHEREKPDVWLAHNVVPVISLGVYRLAADLGAPMIQWLHNYRPISPSGTLFAGKTRLEPDDAGIYWKESLSGSWNGRLLTAWLALGYARARRRGDFSSVKAWVAVSEEMRKMFQRAGWHPDRLVTLRHSWNLSSEPIEPADDGHFLFLGRMVETKGVRFLVDLWRRPEMQKFTLIMAGQGPLAEELRAGSSPNVRWVGHVEGETKQKWINGCRAVLFPCLWPEPLSTVAYEAYERGKPILASDLGGMREIIRDGETGRLLAPADAVAWEEAVRALDLPASIRLGRNGRKWLEEHVSPAAWNRDFDLIVRRALTIAPP